MSQPQNLFSLSYQGVRAPHPPNVIVKNFDPSSTTSNNVAIGDFWITFNPFANPQVTKLWCLLGLSGGVATWVEIIASAGDILTLTGNSGGAINPIGGNINIVTANSSVLVAGNNGTATMTLDFGISNLVLGSRGISISGARNVGLGQGVFFSLANASDNTAVGFGAMTNQTSGSNNTGVGSFALTANSTGSNNVAIGQDALSGITNSSNNIAIGTLAGSNYVNVENSNIVIGNTGTATESHVIRIGTQGSGAGQQNSVYIAGIVGTSVPNLSDTVVVDTVTGQLGVGSGSAIIIPSGSSVVNSTNSSTSPADLNLVKNRSGGPIVSGDQIGCLMWQGYDSTSAPITAGEICVVNPVGSTIGAQRVAGEMDFYTHPDSAAATPTLRMKLQSNGLLSLNLADNDTYGIPESNPSFLVTGGSTISANNQSNTTGGVSGISKSRAGGVVTTGDTIGTFLFTGTDSSNNPINAGAITVACTGTIAANRVPGVMIFGTHPDSASGTTTSPRLQIDQNGVVLINTPDTSTAVLQVTGSISTHGDPGVGIAGATDFTNTTAAAGGAGTFTIKSGSANPANSTGFIKIYVNGSAKYIPFFDNPAP